MSKCSHGIEPGSCYNAFHAWIAENCTLEQTNLWRISQNSRTITRTRIWPDRSDFKPGDWVVSGCSLGGVTEVYEVLQRMGTPKRPYYNLRMIAAACPNNIYPDRRKYHVNKIGSIAKNQAGNGFLRITPKNPDQPLFHCDDTHVAKEDWPKYEEIPKPQKKRRKTKKEDQTK